MAQLGTRDEGPWFGTDGRGIQSASPGLRQFCLGRASVVHVVAVHHEGPRPLNVQAASTTRQSPVHRVEEGVTQSGGARVARPCYLSLRGIRRDRAKYLVLADRPLAK